MHCANPQCGAAADDLLKGILTLKEFETAPDDRILHAAGGFPVCSARTKYFWLCERCSRTVTIRKWNASGLLLESIHGDYSATPELPVRTRPGPQSSPAGPTGQIRLFKVA